MNIDHYIAPFDDNTPNPNIRFVNVWGRDKIKDWKFLADIISGALGAFAIVFRTPEGMVAPVMKWIQDRLGTKGPRLGANPNFKPDILVVDSLNIVEPPDQAEFFQKFLATNPASKMIILVLDSARGNEQHKIWEYASDVVIRLDYQSRHDYYIRSIEIVKARYQAHIWGKHQLKIYKGQPEPGAKQTDDQKGKLRRDHPYREEGGIFIYPSIHYYLSQYKREAPTSPPGRADTRPEELNVVLGGDPNPATGGYPEGRCTAFIGRRGGHKSHLGYLHLLHRVISYEAKEEAAMIISLRDDEKVTRQTLAGILKHEFKRTDAEAALESFEKEDRLEILYYHPGYITPEEFFHRMFISLHRLKQKGKKLTVLFNSLDQLTARFPLCAKQESFVPGIIECLSGEGATSIFIAVDEPGQPVEQHGLLPMADLILSFYPYRFPFADYYRYLYEQGQLDHATGAKILRIQEIRETEKDSSREAIVLQVVRFAGGQNPGGRGILELVDDANWLYSEAGLHFTKLSSRFDPKLP